ncbi:MAG: hypothetical protein WCF84_05645 [Anaerolineae bacterium]
MAAVASVAGVSAAIAAAGAVQQAFRTYGITVWVGIDQFLNILSEQEKPLVIFYESPAGFFKKKSYWYLNSYKGFVFL